MEFDLDALNRQVDAGWRVRLVIVASFLFLIGAIVAVTAVEAAPYLRPGHWAAFQVLDLVIAVVFLGLFLQASLTPSAPYRRGASRLVIGQAGFELVFPDGSVDRYSWQDPRLHVDVIDNSMGPASTRQQTPYIFSGRWQATLLSPAAHEALMAAAREHATVEPDRPGPRYVLLSSARPAVRAIRGRPPSNERT
jgi:hypothetical protein